MNIRISLIAKLTCATSLILLVFMGVLDTINLKNFRKVMVEYAVSHAEQVADIISQSTYDAMMINDKTSLYHMIGRIAENRNLEHIRLIDKKGRVIYSNVKEEIGSVIGKHADECVICHNSVDAGEAPSTMNRSRIITTRSGKEELAFTKAIYNQSACFTASCHFHGADDTVLGLLDISVSLEILRQKSHQYRLQFVMLTCLLLLLIGILITILTHYLVDIPVQRLVRHSAQVASGDLDSRVPVSSRDELGELSDSLNRMTESLGKADRELKGWADSLEQKVAERSREIMRMEEQLHSSEKLASLGTLAAGVAHEINNPLTGILLYASILQSDKRLDRSLLPDVDKVITETQRCAGIVKDLLEFSRESSPVKETVLLDAVLDDVVTFFHKQPDFSGVAIKKYFHGALPPVSVDPNQIRQVFMNIVINAGHAMPHGGVLEISTYLTADEKYACASVKDNGSGIAEENLTKIFDPFFTTKSEGTGLGLSISYGIINNNGGKIEVQSVVGEGTTFIVMFPVSR
ncbi:MAG TPA: HAMP domain-containing protein [Desulfuromonadales bacterium]|nr:HAMP domain-containing protein [Desulfuromonadales bacterium]